MTSAVAQGRPSTLWFGRHLVGAALVALLNPLLYYESNPLLFWLAIVGWALVAGAVVVGLFALFFTERAKRLWPKIYVSITWLFLLLWTFGGWVEYQSIRKGSVERNVNSTAPQGQGSESSAGRSSGNLPVVLGKPTVDDAPTWSSNLFDRFDTVAAIEERARLRPELGQPGAWQAVLAWQAHYADGGKTPANHALYLAVGMVLDGLAKGKGLCKPGKASRVTEDWATPDLPVGTDVVEIACDRS